MRAKLNITLSVAGVDEEDVEELRWNDFEKAKIGSSSIIPRKSSSISFCRVPVRAKRGRTMPEVPASCRRSCCSLDERLQRGEVWGSPMDR